MRLLVDPIDGGRITSLFAQDREWLVPTGRRDGSGEFLGPGTGGWDDIAPTITACDVPGWGHLPDHGDAWRRAWTVTCAGPNRLSTTVSLVSLPLTLRRSINATPERIRLSWTASTNGPDTVPFLWSAHPLFAAPPGTHIDFGPAAESEITVCTATPGAPGRSARIDDFGPGHMTKLFLARRSNASVVHADGATVRLTWNPELLPHLGLYFDRDVYTRTPVVAPEPTNAPHDAASEAFHGLPTVGPTEPLHWWIDVTTASGHGHQ